MDFFESLFDFNGDGKVDWLDTADELAVLAIIEDEEERRHADDFDDDYETDLDDTDLDGI